MPKVDLDKITLGLGPMTGKVYAGTVEKPGLWRHKTDVSAEFVGVVIRKWEGKKDIVQSEDGSRWEIYVKKLPMSKAKKKAIKRISLK